MKRVGLVVNPLAGIGGPAGMKGSDRETSILQARRLKIEPPAPMRTRDVLEKVRKTCAKPFVLVSAPGVMGAATARDAGFEHIPHFFESQLDAALQCCGRQFLAPQQ